MAHLQLPPGYHRAPASDDVIHEAAAHLRQVALAESGRQYASVEDYANFWRAPFLDREHDIALVRGEDGTLAAQAVVVNRPPYTEPISIGLVSPQHHGRGLGSALLEWQEARAREGIGEAPDGARVALESFVDSRHDRSTTLLTDHGFAPDRYFVTMALDFDGGSPQAEFPPSFALRTWSDDQLEAAARTAAESFEDHYGYVERPMEARLDELRHRTQHPGFDPTLQWHLYEGDELVAVNWCNPDHEGDDGVGYVQTLGVRRPWRGRGLARNLLLLSFAEFRLRGKRGVALDVDADSITGATRLYESVGMTEVHRRTRYSKEIRAGADLARRS